MQHVLEYNFILQTVGNYLTIEDAVCLSTSSKSLMKKHILTYVPEVRPLLNRPLYDSSLEFQFSKKLRKLFILINEISYSDFIFLSSELNSLSYLNNQMNGCFFSCTSVHKYEHSTNTAQKSSIMRMFNDQSFIRRWGVFLKRFCIHIPQTDDVDIKLNLCILSEKDKKFKIDECRMERIKLLQLFRQNYIILGNEYTIHDAKAVGQWLDQVCQVCLIV
jgi:hypothetical protein